MLDSLKYIYGRDKTYDKCNHSICRQRAMQATCTMDNCPTLRPSLAQVQQFLIVLTVSKRCISSATQYRQCPLPLCPIQGSSLFGYSVNWWLKYKQQTKQLWGGHPFYNNVFLYSSLHTVRGPSGKITCYRMSCIQYGSLNMTLIKDGGQLFV